MRLMTALLLCSLCGSLYAYEAPQTPQAPAGLQALPPPQLDAKEPVDDSVDEPQVTITKQTEQTVEEYRVSGRLYMIKITPKTGKPYYLIDESGAGKFTRHEGLGDDVSVPRWVLFHF